MNNLIRNPAQISNEPLLMGPYHIALSHKIEGRGQMPQIHDNGVVLEEWQNISPVFRSNNLLGELLSFVERGMCYCPVAYRDNTHR